MSSSPPSAEPKFTMVEGRILAVLNDGEPHHWKKLIFAVDEDGICSRENLNRHISNIRKKLPDGHYIVCCLQGYAVHYRRVIRYQSGDENG